MASSLGAEKGTEGVEIYQNFFANFEKQVHGPKVRGIKGPC